MEEESRQQKLEKMGEFWKNHLDKWADSGMSQSEYCRQYNLSRYRFAYWKARIKKETLPVTLVQIPSDAMPAQPSFLRLNLPRGLQIEIPDDFSRITLERVLVALKEM